MVVRSPYPCRSIKAYGCSPFICCSHTGPQVFLRGVLNARLALSTSHFFYSLRPVNTTSVTMESPTQQRPASTASGEGQSGRRSSSHSSSKITPAHGNSSDYGEDDFHDSGHEHSPPRPPHSRQKGGEKRGDALVYPRTNIYAAVSHQEHFERSEPRRRKHDGTDDLQKDSLEERWQPHLSCRAELTASPSGLFQERRAADLFSATGIYSGLSWFCNTLFSSSEPRSNAYPPPQSLSSAMAKDVASLKVWLYWSFKWFIIYLLAIQCLGFAYQKATYKVDRVTSAVCNNALFRRWICSPRDQEPTSYSKPEKMAAAQEMLEGGLLNAGQSHYLNRDSIDIGWYMSDLHSDITASELKSKDQLARLLGSMIDSITDFSR